MNDAIDGLAELLREYYTYTIEINCVGGRKAELKV